MGGLAFLLNAISIVFDARRRAKLFVPYVPNYISVLRAAGVATCCHI